jgi:hypothetical protein
MTGTPAPAPAGAIVDLGRAEKLRFVNQQASHLRNLIEEIRVGMEDIDLALRSRRG